jgi:hypothetical protein
MYSASDVNLNAHDSDPSLFVSLHFFLSSFLCERHEALIPLKLDRENNFAIYDEKRSAVRSLIP